MTGKLSPLEGMVRVCIFMGESMRAAELLREA